MPCRVERRKSEWACRVEIARTSQEPTHTFGRGIDALQALVNALSAVRHALRNELGTLTWLGVPGEIGVPRMVPDEDPDFLALFEHLLLAERYRVVLAKKAGHRSRSKSHRKR